MPYRGMNFIEFPQDKHANTLIFFAENTKGKTSILNALKWVLYGSVTYKGKELSYKEIVNTVAYTESGSKAEVKVTLEFEVDGENCKLTRSMSGEDESEKSGKSRLQKGPAVLTTEEKEIYLEQIVPESTSRFFLFDGEMLREYEKLMDPTEYNSRKIKKAIEDVMGFPALSNSINILNEINKKCKNETSQQKTVNNALDTMKEERDQKQSTLTVKKEELSAHKDLIQEEDKKLDEATKKVEKNKETKTILDNRQKLVDKRNAAADARTFQLDILNGIKKDIWRSILGVKVIKEVQPAITNQKKINAIDLEKNKLKSQIEQLDTIDDKGTCPTCDQKKALDSGLKRRHDNYSKQYSDLEKELVDFGSQNNLDKWIKVGEKFQNASQLKDFYSAEKAHIDSTQKFYSHTRELEALEKDFTSDLTFDNLESDVSTMIKLQLKQRDNEKIKKDLDDEIEILASATKKLSESISKASTGSSKSSEQAYLTSQKLNTIFEATQSILRGNIKEQVQKVANEAFRKMISRPDDFTELQITDTYGLHIMGNDGNIVSQRSAGAEQVVALALIVGLNRVGKSPGPVLMDTPFGRLDEIHREKIIIYMSNSARQFVLFVHSGELKKNSPIVNSIKERIGKTYNIESKGPYVAYLDGGA